MADEQRERRRERELAESEGADKSVRHAENRRKRRLESCGGGGGAAAAAGGGQGDDFELEKGEQLPGLLDSDDDEDEDDNEAGRAVHRMRNRIV